MWCVSFCMHSEVTIMAAVSLQTTGARATMLSIDFECPNQFEICPVTWQPDCRETLPTWNLLEHTTEPSRAFETLCNEMMPSANLVNPLWCPNVIWDHPQSIRSCELWLAIFILTRLVHRTCTSLWHSDAIWCHRTGSTLFQVMSCCLTAPNHYHEANWLFIIEGKWYPYEGDCILCGSLLRVRIFTKCFYLLWKYRFSILILSIFCLD